MNQEKYLWKYYKKQLKLYNKMDQKKTEAFMGYLVTYLRYRRDKLLLEEENYNPETNLKIASICLALSEYDSYVNCIFKYYDISNNNIQAKKGLELSAEEILKLFQDEKLQHWNNFCELFRVNMENWLA